jgi:hypothetical protein
VKPAEVREDGYYWVWADDDWLLVEVLFSYALKTRCAHIIGSGEEYYLDTFKHYRGPLQPPADNPSEKAS